MNEEKREMNEVAEAIRDLPNESKIAILCYLNGMEAGKQIEKNRREEASA